MEVFMFHVMFRVDDNVHVNVLRDGQWKFSCCRVNVQ